MVVWDDFRCICQKKDSKQVIKMGCSRMPYESLGTPRQSEHFNNAPFKFIMPLLLEVKKYF
ncbi:hypothetical protein D8Z77_07865 [Brevibacillus laterosporus]|nr:hypothetical protein D8Z77_07865 [Brevibacillus laterosporus]